MYKGKHTRKIPRHKRLSALAVSLALLLTMGIGATLAWLSDTTPGLVNEFTPVSDPPEVTESFEGTLKKDVQVINKGNIPAYIRAAIVATWQKVDAEGHTTGELAPDAPVLGTDYTLTLADSGWQQQGGYHYCLTSVEPSEMTPELIESATQLREKDGYKLVIEILAQTIQSDGTDKWGNKPIELAWNVDIEGGALKEATIVTE